MSISLAHALSSHLMTEEECKERYSSFVSITTRLLGEAPIDFLRLMSLSPLLYDTCAALLRGTFNIPACELGLSNISATQRRIAFFEASRTHGAPYCTSHCAVFGDILRGSFGSQCLQAGGIKKMEGGEKPENKHLRSLVQGACSFPLRTATLDETAFLDHFGMEGFSELSLMVSFMGWLNVCNNIAGIELEKSIAPISEVLVPQALMPGGVWCSVSQTGDSSQAELKARLLSGGDSIGAWARLRYYFQNASEFCKTLPALWDADREERSLMRGIPDVSGDIHEWLLQNLGCELELSKGVSDSKTLRVIAFCARHAFLVENMTSWSMFEKLAMLYAFGKHAQNETLSKDAVAIFTGQTMQTEFPLKTPSERQRHENWNQTLFSTEERFDKLYETRVSGEESKHSFSAVINFVANSAGYAGSISACSMRDTIDHVNNAKDVVDLVALCGTFAMFHRLTAFLKLS